MFASKQNEVKEALLNIRNKRKRKYKDKKKKKKKKERMGKIEGKKRNKFTVISTWN